MDRDGICRKGVSYRGGRGELNSRRVGYTEGEGSIENVRVLYIEEESENMR